MVINMKKNILLLLLFFLPLAVFAKDYELGDLLQAATVNHPLAAQLDVQNQITTAKQKNIVTNYYPSLSLNGSALYNSDIVDFSSITAGLPAQFNLHFPQMPHEQYKATMALNQLIWDGGSTSKIMDLEKIDNQINSQSIVTDISQIKTQIADLFYSVITLGKQREIIMLYNETISDRIKTLQIAVDAGAAMQMNVDILDAEQIKNGQTLDEIAISLDVLHSALSRLTGLNITSDDKLILKEIVVGEVKELSRPELKLFDLQKDKLTKSGEMLGTTLMPKAALFAEAGWGKPAGMNFFSDKFEFYYTFGATLKWNFFDWFKTSRSREITEISKDLVNSQSANFTRNIEIALDNLNGEIEKISKSIIADARIISIREEVTKTAEIRLTAGVITSTEYLTEFNAERQARLSLETHLVQLEQTKAKYLLIAGKL
jgi:outer membrane protein TolC